MVIKVRIFNPQQVLAMAACIGLRKDKKHYNQEGILIRTKASYDESRIRYKSGAEFAFVFCEDEEGKNIFSRLVRSGFSAEKMSLERYMLFVNSKNKVKS